MKPTKRGERHKPLMVFLTADIDRRLRRLVKAGNYTLTSVVAVALDEYLQREAGK